MAQNRSFAATDRFISEVSARKLRPAYVLIGDESFFRDRCQQALIEHLVQPEWRDFSLHQLDLAEISVFEVLNRARTASLMAPFQVFFVKGVKSLYGRGSHAAEFAEVKAYCKNPNPDAVVIFIADHVSIPADVRRMDLASKDRYERIRETLGESCGMIELARVEEGDGIRWVVDSAAQQGVVVEAEAARELVDSLGANMLLVSNELEKLILYAGDKKKITPGDVETMVLAAKERSIYELTDAISAKDPARALGVLHAILAGGEGDEAAIGHLFMLAKSFRQMLVIFEENVRDTRALWQALWQGFRVPPFAADDILRQARRYKTRGELTRSLRMVARADLTLRSNPASKRTALENLVLQLSSESRGLNSEDAQHTIPQ